MKVSFQIESLLSETTIEITKKMIAICLEIIFSTNCYQKTFKPDTLIRLRLLFDRREPLKEKMLDVTRLHL